MRDLAEIENIAKAPPIAYADYYVLNNGTMDDEIANGIHIIYDKKDFKDERIYSLSGQFLGIGLENLENGIYIINNEKYILK